jgi:serine/threonine-protein kinase
MRHSSAAAGVSREEFVRGLKDSGILSGDDLDRALEGLAGADLADAAALARRLTDAGHLTPYQAEALLQRRHDELLFGSYLILDRLGAGGMGTVFKARHARMKRLVALKLLTREAAGQGTFARRFQREVETIAQLSHPNIVMAFDAGEAEAGLFLVMEFVNGRDLGREVQERGPLPVADAVNCVLQAARGLEYAHGQGVIHRDVKPANLLRDAAGVVKVADLGLARFNDTLPAGTSGVTQAGNILGTADYMPPEQATDSAHVDHRADVYSLGCTLHFLLTGRPPYVAASVMATLFKHSSAPIPSLRMTRPDVPAALDDLFARMVAKTPAERPQTMTDVVRALEGLVLQDVPVPAGLAPAAPPQPSTGTPDAGAQTLVNPAVAVAPTLDFAAPPGAAKTSAPVLLVEPSRTQAGIIRRMLQEAGADNVQVAPSGKKALEALRQPPGGVRPRAVVSAMHLDDMTGAELVGTMRADPALAGVGFVLITSSLGDSPPEPRLAGAAHTALLPKPFDRETLGRALAEVGGMTAGQAPPRSATPGLTNPTFAALRVLLVDDSPAVRSHIRRTLQQLGFLQITEASDGTEAVAILSRETFDVHGSSVASMLRKERFDLVITDYNMPLLDGRGLVGFIRQQSECPSVPILMVTSETDPAKLEAARRLGATEICDKSFEARTVLPVLNRVLKQ